MLSEHCQRDFRITIRIYLYSIDPIQAKDVEDGMSIMNVNILFNKTPKKCRKSVGSDTDCSFPVLLFIVNKMSNIR